MDFLTLPFFYGGGKTNENDLPQNSNSNLGVNDTDKRDNVRAVNERDSSAFLFNLPPVRESRKRKRSGTIVQTALKKKNLESCSDQVKVNESVSEKISAQDINQEPSSCTVKKFFKNSACRKSDNYYRGFCSSQKYRAKSKLGSELFKRISQENRLLSGSETFVRHDLSNEENNTMHSSIDEDEHHVRGSSASDSSEEIHGTTNDDVQSSKSNSFEKKDKQLTQLKLMGDGKVLKLHDDSTSNSVVSPRRCTRNAIFKSRDQSQQMLLDFGQKMGGPIQCDVCGLTYNKYERHDEQFHAKYHKKCLSTLRFNISSKDRILQSFSDGGVIIVLLETDKTWAKVTEIKKQIDSELGFVIEKKSSIPCKAFLYIKDNQVIGFCMAQAVQHGYKMVHKSSSDDDEDRMPPTDGKSQPFCCSKVPEAIKCGINRIWVAKNERRKGTATRLLDVVRGHFALGLPLSKTDIAFSDPTPDGMALATKYTESPNFLVYSNSGQ